MTFKEQAAAFEKLAGTYPLVRAINYHNTPRARLAEYERQFEWCRRHFSPVDEDDLDKYLSTGRWHKPKPGMILAFYNGYRDNYDVIFPLLERYGLVGWFLASSGFVATPPAEQLAFAARHTLRTVPDEYPDGRYALSWSELRELDRQHVVGSHTRNHARLSITDTDQLEGEILGSQQDFEKNLGHRVRSFASQSGAAYGEQPAADRLVDAAGYQFVISNLKIQRLRDHPAKVVR